jgi:hypothetical protein
MNSLLTKFIFSESRKFNPKTDMEKYYDFQEKDEYYQKINHRLELNKDEEQEHKLQWIKSQPGVRFIDQGSSRCVFALDNKYALKVAGDIKGNDDNSYRKGIAQNKVEYKLSLNSEIHDVLAKVYDNAPDYEWIVSDLVRPLNDNDENTFYELTGVTFNAMMSYLYQVENGDKPPSLGYFVSQIEKAIKLGKLALDDFRPDQFGKTADGRIVILDYGFSDDVQQNYYRSRSNEDGY